MTHVAFTEVEQHVCDEMLNIVGSWFLREEVEKCVTANGSCGDKIINVVLRKHTGRVCVFVLCLFIQTIISSTHFPGFLQRR